VRARLDPLMRRLGDRQASELTPLLWAEHRAVRSVEPSGRGARKPPCAHLLNIELFRTKEMLRFAVANKLLEASPLEAAKPARAISARETWIEEADLQRLLKACGDLRDGRRRRNDPHDRPALMRAFILCCFDSMLRFNEARHLRRDRIGLNGLVELSAHATKGRKMRVVALTDRTIAAIKAIPVRSPDPHVFHNFERGGLYAEQTIRFHFRAACKQAGVDERVAPGDGRLHIHDLRHSGASVADANGASALAIKEALGHSKLSTTERYMHHNKVKSALALAGLMQASAAKGGR
jgi:integrase